MDVSEQKLRELLAELDGQYNGAASERDYPRINELNLLIEAEISAGKINEEAHMEEE